MTLITTSDLESYFLTFWIKIIAYNLKTTDQILMQFYTAMCFTS